MKGEDEATSPDSSARKPAAPQGQSPKSKLPPILNHFNSRDLKTLFRCAVAFWVSSLLIFIQPALKTFGSATFFACVVTLFLPPSGVLMVFLLGGLTMIIGMGLGWAWGVIVMKAAQAARPASETQAQLQMLAHAAASTGVSSQVLIFNGLMLDTRVTVTWLCLLGLFMYLMARLRMKIPKLTLTAIFAWIVTDIFLTIGPLLPTFNGTLPLLLIEPAAASLAISLACSILIFPESTSHLTLTELHKFTGLAKGVGPKLSQYLENPMSTETDSETEKLKKTLVGLWSAIGSTLGFLPFDFSWGHWGAQDIQTLQEPFKRLLVSVLSLVDVQLVHHERDQRAAKVTEEDEKTKQPFGRHQIMETLNLLELVRHEDVEKSVTESFHALSKSARPLLDACNTALEAIAESIHHSKSSKWFNQPSREALEGSQKAHATALQDLRSQIGQFHPAANEALLASHEHLFDDSGKFATEDEMSRHKLSGLFIGLTIEDRLGRFAGAVELVLAQVQAIEVQRPRRRVWLPSQLDKFFPWVFGSSPVKVDGIVQTDAPPELDKESKEELALRLKRTSRPPRRQNLLSRVILGTAHWLSDDEGIFALRIVIASIALAVIAANRNTAGFFYQEKGLWALIMAQTGMVLQFADFSFGVATRVLGTVVGGVVGMVGWYIGSGNGPGNPYGLAAVMAVLGTVIMWFRLYAPPQLLQQVMISAATFVLVIGYSYIDTHNPSYGNPGVGYEVFYRRIVLVIIGFATSFVVSLIPWPTSQSRFVARSLSHILHTEADHYAVLLSSWKKLDENERFVPAIESAAIHIAGSLEQLEGPIVNLRYEFSSSAFDSKTCARVNAISGQLNRHLAVMYILGTHLPSDLRERFAKSTGFLHDSTIANVMSVFSVIEQALKTGDALPARLPTPLVKQCLGHSRGADIATLTKDMLRNRDARVYTIIMSSYLGMLSLLDELVLVMKGALGESHLIPQDLES